MIHMLVVDDEPVILEHLSMIPWESIGVTSVLTAVSAMDALEIIHHQPVDLVITDIRMPGMSGIELCEKIREEQKTIKCILLSGHAEFEYAKQALKSGAVDYLLKPVENEVMLRMVAQTVNQIRREGAEKSVVQNTMYTLRSQLPALQSAFLHRISTGRQLSPEAMEGKLNELALPFAAGAPVALMMLRLEGLLSDADERHLPIYEFAVNNMAEETFGEHFHTGFFKNEFNYLVFTAMPKRPISANGEGTALLEKLAATLQKRVSEYLKGTVSAVLSHFGRFPNELPELYQQTLKMVQKLSGQENETLIRLWDLPVNPSFKCLQTLHMPPALSQLYETGRTEDADEKLEQIFQEILEKGLDTQEHLLEVFFYLSHAFSYIVHRSGKHLADVLEQKQGMNVDPREFRSVRQLQEWAHAVHNSIVENTVPRKTTSLGSLVHQIHLYIEQHIADVSLQMLADHLSLHPAYISAMYKQETGENLSDHILRYRMEKSGYLVRNTRMKIYEIAAQLGYQHTPYFSKLFKSHYGVTPQDYRDRFH